MEDAKTSFNVFCAVIGIGSLAMPSNYARAGPVYATIPLGFMMFANTYAAIKLSRCWRLHRPSRLGVCVLVPIAYLILGSTLLDVSFPDTFGRTFWIIFVALMVVPVSLIPMLKESAGMAFAGCMGTAIADIIAVAILQWNMRGHPSIPKPDVSVHQVLTCFGNLAVAYGAAIVIPDLQREHSQPQRMPRVLMVSIVLISAFFFAIAVVGYLAGGCQISGNVLYSIVDTSNPLGQTPLGFTSSRAAVVMAYLFMQVHIAVAFSTLMMPAFYVAERLILGMHKTSAIVRFNPDQDQEIIDQDLELQEKYSDVHTLTPMGVSGHGVSASSLVEKSEVPRGDHEEQLREPYKGIKNKLRYITLRLTIITIMVVIGVAAQNKFLDLEDFTGATAHTVNYMVMPVLIHVRVFWKIIAGVYVMIHAGKKLFSPSDDDTAFPYCDAEYQDEPYYIRNRTS
ncbi:hypothetical protein PHYSODRAFT_330341 [Phytophthora sojae]|uniref:Amino acid transporter transmembrane domain-containing protein n=1 Tax=Phytophthora sojae (strain P6497) TaxID=1094619 RepID=G4Z8M5_PHYSP|nr:hypothetical protein PHYSODRAFT_330341 [Phytophthora sojae]EGZ22576.1 hypothetical protein PHYSODRAFT_330341 [Phytophthora sojae]|eukprot:XP_009525293.1 hypothetical protein PHYSODRAFT_330341 [Phytophthora sojae]